MSELHKDGAPVGGSMILILARSYEKAYECADKNRLGPGAWRYARDARSTAGVRGALVWKYQDYYERTGAYDVERLLQNRGCRVEWAPEQ